jgi:hypothetical protein
MSTSSLWQASQKNQMVDLNALNCLQFFKWGNNETEQHSGVVHDQLDGLSSWQRSSSSTIRKRLLYFVPPINNPTACLEWRPTSYSERSSWLRIMNLIKRETFQILKKQATYRICRIDHLALSRQRRCFAAFDYIRVSGFNVIVFGDLQCTSTQQ